MNPGIKIPGCGTKPAFAGWLDSSAFLVVNATTREGGFRFIARYFNAGMSTVEFDRTHSTPLHMKPLPAADLEHVRAHAPWEELRAARIFITGGTGFFGAWLLESFCDANDALKLHAHATILTRDAAKFKSKMPHLAGRDDLDFLEGDVRDFKFPSGEFSHIVHGATAASAHLNDNAPREMSETIVRGTQRVCEWAQTSGARRMLMLSSGAVYGVQPPEISHVPETYKGAPDPLDIAAAYGNGKRAAEWECTLAAHASDVEIAVARCFAFVGPHLPLDAHFAAGNFLGYALRGETIRVGGDGTPLRSYLYAADLAAWLWTILVHGQNKRAYNVGSDEAVSVEELARRCAALGGSEVEIARTPDKTVLPARYVPDVSRARDELSLDVRISLDDALRRTWNWNR